jgi:hypothetical protein
VPSQNCLESIFREFADISLVGERLGQPPETEFPTGVSSTADGIAAMMILTPHIRKKVRMSGRPSRSLARLEKAPGFGMTPSEVRVPVVAGSGSVHRSRLVHLSG